MKKNDKLSPFEMQENITVQSKVEIIEEYKDVDKSLIELEKNTNIIRLDMNTIEHPLFSKAKNRLINQGKKYFFKTDGTSYLEVTPTLNSKIPGEFEERIFLALIKIMRDNNYSSSFYTTSNEILRNMSINNISGYYQKKLKEGIDIIASTTYTFFNSMYSYEEKGIIKEEIKTSIMGIRRIIRGENIEESIGKFKDKRVKEVYQISLSEQFYKNIIKKGYLTFDSEKLLNMKNPTTRSIYQLIEKWRGYDHYLKRKAFHIARRIPLSWDKRHLTETINRLKASCDELKKLKLIRDYEMINYEKLELSEFEFFFDESHNLNKRASFYDDKDYTKGLEKLITHTEPTKVKDKNGHLEDALIVKDKKKLTPKQVQRIKESLPVAAQKLKSIDRAIKELGKQYEFEYLLICAEYTAKNAKKSYRRYFIDTAENDWAEELRIKKERLKRAKKIEEAKREQLQLKAEKEKQRKKAEKEKQEEIYQQYLGLYKPTQEHIKEKAIEEFKSFYGSNEKLAEKILNPEMIKSFIITYLEVNPLETLKSQEKNEKIIATESQELYNIEEYFDSIGMFAYKVLEILENLEIENHSRVLEILKMFKEFKGTLDEFEIDIKFNELEMSYIKISREG